MVVLEFPFIEKHLQNAQVKSTKKCRKKQKFSIKKHSKHHKTKFKKRMKFSGYTYIFKDKLAHIKQRKSFKAIFAITVCLLKISFSNYTKSYAD